MDCVTKFKQAINLSSKSGSVGNNCTKIEFRLDVFWLLFDCRGQPPISGKGLLYILDDFDNHYFMGEWYDDTIGWEMDVRWSFQCSCTHTSSGLLRASPKPTTIVASHIKKTRL